MIRNIVDIGVEKLQPEQQHTANSQGGTRRDRTYFEQLLSTQIIYVFLRASGDYR